MTLSDLLSDCYRRLNYQTAPASAVTTRLTAFLNESIDDILSRAGLSDVLHGTITFASVANQPEYALPGSVARVLMLTDTANQYRLTPLTEDAYRAITPAPLTQTGTPTGYALLGLTPCALRPSDASQLFVKSSDAGDTTQTVKYEVITSAGYRRSGSVALTGTTAVSLNAALTDIVEVTDFYLSAACLGVVSLLEDSGVGTVLSTIGIGITREMFQHLALIATPAAPLTYTLQYELDTRALVNSTDEPALPPRFHRIVGVGARWREYEHLKDERRLMVEREYLAGIGQLIAYLGTQPDAVIIPGRTLSPPSVLGPWFPSSPYRSN